ncbi:MAG: 2-amino-4-hydroxy-6-hydroxymethyldihydropteridine diphosphokinase [Gammaproteobacteria bacterium]|nr:2-amino-4-hydroxy-6-hydroxymethyldihydropteridine diphosphokinase [Gammaproteobacteria bacterium]
MTPPPARALVGVGSNLAPARNIAGGLEMLTDQFGALELSTTYLSAALDGLGDPYWNLVVAFSTGLNWSQLRARLKLIEDLNGRVRGAPAGDPVALDLDLLVLCGAGREDEFDLPLDGLAGAGHVLAPLAELAGDWVHPDAHCTVTELWARAAPFAPALDIVVGAPWAAVRARSSDDQAVSV